MGICPVQGLVNAEGSSTVNSYRIVSGAVRVKRSTNLMFWLERWKRS